MFATVGILAALQGRAVTGLGTYVDVSMTDSLVSWMSALLGPVMNGGTPFDGIEEPAYGMFQSADGQVLTLSIAHEDHFWRKLCGISRESWEIRISGPASYSRPCLAPTDRSNTMSRNR